MLAMLGAVDLCEAQVKAGEIRVCQRANSQRSIQARVVQTTALHPSF